MKTSPHMCGQGRLGPFSDISYKENNLVRCYAKENQVAVLWKESKTTDRQGAWGKSKACRQSEGFLVHCLSSVYTKKVLLDPIMKVFDPNGTKCLRLPGLKPPHLKGEDILVHWNKPTQSVSHHLNTPPKMPSKFIQNRHKLTRAIYPSASQQGDPLHQARWNPQSRIVWLLLSTRWDKC